MDPRRDFKFLNVFALATEMRIKCFFFLEFQKNFQFQKFYSWNLQKKIL